MSNITTKSYARITLFLKIIKRLESGYHELNSIKQEIALHDVITFEDSDRTEIILAKNSNNNSKYFPLYNNSIIKTVGLMKDMFNINKNLRIEIEKHIPIGGGLAGGSSNAAATIKALNKLWRLNLDNQGMITVAQKIGMDVSFFIYGKTCFDTEATFHLDRLNNFPKYYVVLVNPGFGISTKDEYNLLQLEELTCRRNNVQVIKELIRHGDVGKIFNYLYNDFELHIFKKYPQLEKIKRDLLENNAIASLMSGSGSTIYGIYHEKSGAESAFSNLSIRYKNVMISHTI